MFVSLTLLVFLMCVCESFSDGIASAEVDAFIGSWLSPTTSTFDIIRKYFLVLF